MLVPSRAANAAVAFLLLLTAVAVVAAAGNEPLKSMRAACLNEGEPVPVPLHDVLTRSCFHCVCKNGFVECKQEQCGSMDDCAVMMPKEGCCARCKGCWYNGTEHLSHTEWNDKDGKLIRCEAGVVTISRPECYSPCARPKHQRHTHYNCPVCDHCVINGQRVWEGRDVRIPEEPCLSCRCVHGALSCAKKACPVLPCSKTYQTTPPGECCPRCIHPTSDKILPGHMTKPCIIGTDYHAHLSAFWVDPCTDCRCMNGTAVCSRHTCPVLTCGARALPPPPGKCCPECPRVEEAKAACVIAGNTYQDGEIWQLDACKSCECHGGEPRCAMERCPSLTCPSDQTLRRLPDQCCPKCVDKDGICTVFGDPHYKTFDGKFYSFQGSCKYQLVADCVNNTFSLRISNDARNTSHSSWTRTATLRIGGTKINMGRRMRVKVNGTRVTLPYDVAGVGRVARGDGGVLLAAAGLQLLWDGDGFLEVTVSSSYKGKLCGLCGNFNSIARDDLTTREGSLTKDPWRFGDSWRVGGRRACSRRAERRGPGRAATRARCGRFREKRAHKLCRQFDHAEVFAACGAKLNPHNYREACVRDACGCGANARCHCAAYRAYARECGRVGAAPLNWERAAWCDASQALPAAPPRHPKRIGTDLLGIGTGLATFSRPSGGRSLPPPPIL